MKSEPITAPLKVAWAFAAFSLAIMAMGAQIDRQAHRDQKLAHLVPRPFQSYALEWLAKEAYAGGDVERGLAYSRTLVVRRPVPAEGLALLANGLVASKQDALGLRVLLLSARRGWRDRFTQQVMVASAEQAGDFPVAAQRLLALWRTGDKSPATRHLTQNLLGTQSGAIQFALGMAPSDRWASDFLILAVEFLPPSSLGVIASTLQKKSIPIDCLRLSEAMREIVRNGQAANALVLWSSFCSTNQTTGPSDFAFRPLGARPGPFDWQFPDQAGLEIQFVQSAGQSIINFSNHEQSRVIFARRYAILAPGTHRLTISTSSRHSLESSPLLIQMVCFSKGGASETVMRMDAKDKYLNFDIPVSGCPAQELRLSVSRGGGQISGLRIE